MIDFINDYRGAFRLVSRDVRMYLIASALLGLSYFGFVSVLLNLYLLRLDYDLKFIGLANAITAMAFAISSIPSGASGDRWGYRRIVIVGFSLISASAILVPLAEFLPDVWQISGILISRVLGGLGFALYIVNANPYLVAATEHEERNHVFSVHVALPPVFGFLGSMISGVLPGIFASLLGVSLDHPAPFRYSLILGGALLIPAVLAIYTTQDVATRDSSSSAETKENSSPIPFMIIGFLAVTMMLRMAGEGAGRTFFNVYLDAGLGVSTAGIGILTAVGQGLAGPAALVAPLLISRAGKISTVVLATFGTATSLVLMGLVPHWSIVGLGFMGVIGMRAVTQSVIGVVQMEIVPRGRRGITSGITSMAMGTGFSSMALGGGYIIPVLGYRGLYFIAAGVVALGGVVFWSYFRTPRGEYAQVISGPGRESPLPAKQGMG